MYKKIALFLALFGLIALFKPPIVQAAFPGRDGKIAYNEVVIDGDDRYYNIHDINLDGTNKQNLVTKSMQGELAPSQMPSYSADGTKIVTSSVDPENSAVNIFIANADGTGPTRLTHYTDFNTSAISPRFNSDSTKIIYTEFTYNQSDLESVIKTMDLDGSNQQQLNITGSQQCDSFPVYSPDSSKIIFSRKSSTDLQYSGGIFIANADGSNPQKLVDNYSDSDPACNIFNFIGFPSFDWSPDGSKVVYSDSLDDGYIITTAIKTIDVNSMLINTLKSYTFYNDFSDVGETLKAVQYTPSGKIIFSISSLEQPMDLIGKSKVGIVDQNGQNEYFIPGLETAFNDETSFAVASYVNYNFLSVQPIPYVNTSTFINPNTNNAVELVTPDGTDITCSNAVEPSLLSNKDSFTYPLGLVEFCFDTKSENNQVTLTFVTDLKPNQVIARKYNSTKGTYSNIEGATISETTFQNKHALKLVYSIQDNGELDLDPAIGSIMDPVGLALKETLADTGASPTIFILVSLISIVGSSMYLKKRYI